MSGPFHEANSVKAEAVKRAIFLVPIGPSVYKLQCNLLALGCSDCSCS